MNGPSGRDGWNGRAGTTREAREKKKKADDGPFIRHQPFLVVQLRFFVGSRTNHNRRALEEQRMELSRAAGSKLHPVIRMRKSSFS